jgi:hypothetical protein
MNRNITYLLVGSVIAISAMVTYKIIKLKKKEEIRNWFEAVLVGPEDI